MELNAEGFVQTLHVIKVRAGRVWDVTYVSVHQHRKFFGHRNRPLTPAWFGGLENKCQVARLKPFEHRMA